MKRSEWLDAGLMPAFGTVNQWITDQLGTLGAEEESCYAIRDVSGRAEGAAEDGPPVRILVACDIGLADLRWVRPGGADTNRLTSVLIPWREVSPPRIEGETRPSGALIHQPPTWTLTLVQPQVRIEDPEDPSALLAFWRACAKACGALGEAG
jgi:hypothetical protein